MIESYQKNTEFLLLVKKHFSLIHADSYRNLETSKVIKVIDGDGLLVRKGEESLNIRLAYIDAPEHNQEYGLDSKKWLENQFSNTASVIAIRFIALDEKHGRHIADVFINRYYEKRLTQEWVDTLIHRVENWVIKSSSLID